MTNEEAIKQLEITKECDVDTVAQIKALDVAIAALRNHSVDTTKMEPLTLEQLRKMDGKPVWIVESPDWGHWELSEDAGDYISDRDTDLYGLKYPDPDGKGGLHKLGWLAYAYPPAHIDREAWVSVKCRMPAPEQDVLLAFETGRIAVGGKYDNEDGWYSITDAEYYTDCDTPPLYWKPLLEFPTELENRLNQKNKERS